MIETDILIIGAGPTGLFTVFEAGLSIIDVLMFNSVEEIRQIQLPAYTIV